MFIARHNVLRMITLHTICIQKGHTSSSCEEVATTNCRQALTPADTAAEHKIVNQQ